MSPRLKIGRCCLMASALALVVLQRSAISKASEENQRLRQDHKEWARLQRENESIPELRTQNQEIAGLNRANEDLLKLRNEVGQLRAQAPQVANLQAENQRLAFEIKSMAEGKVSHLSEMKGYVAKEAWSNAGFASPEAALQTFFWAVQEGQFNQIAECLSPVERRHLEKGFAQDDKEEWGRVLQEHMGLTRMGGYRIAEREPVVEVEDAAFDSKIPAKQHISEDKVVLGVQAAVGGAIIKWHLERVGNEWRIHLP